MKRKIRYTLLAVIAAGILLALFHFYAGPLLYSLEKDTFASRFHDNADALRQQGLNSTTDIAPELQDLIDFTGPVSLNIRIHNVDQARRDFERFAKSRGLVKNLIIKLDMNESEIQELERDTALQQQVLDSLFNTTISLDALQTLEVQYNEQGNSDMLTTIRLQGNDLRSKVKGLSAKYRNATESVIANGKKLGLNTTKAEESQKYVDQIIKNIEQPSPETQLKVDTNLIPGEDRISLFIRPNIGRYRDSIEYQGIALTLVGNTTIRSVGTPVTIYENDLQLAQAKTDSYGYYDIKVPIERALIGPNTIYATAPSVRSVNRTLTTIPVNSSTTLVVTKMDEEGNVNCTGLVMANVPVRLATVTLSVDESSTYVIKADTAGRYKRVVQLAPGKHTLVARFSGDEYPIYASESDPVSITISLIPGVEMDDRLIPLIVVSAIIVLLTAGGGYYYYKRITRRKIHLLDLAKKYIPGLKREEPEAAISFEDLLEEPGPELTKEIPRKEDETLIMYYTRILREQGISAASRIAYKSIAARVARDLRIRKHQTLTAREMARNCRGKPYCGTFSRFTAAYERVRYGGAGTGGKDQEVFETAMEQADEQTGGEDH